MVFSRRDFLTTAGIGALSLGLEGQDRNKADSTKSEAPSSTGKRLVIISSWNGFDYLDDAYAFLKDGGDTLDAALKVVKGPEDDPNDDSVGLGGLPNEEGVVELDSCCMHGPTRRAGSVGGVRAHRARDAGGRRRRALCRRPGFSARKLVDRAIPQNLAAVEGNSFRLVGARIGRSKLEKANALGIPERGF